MVVRRLLYPLRHLAFLRVSGSPEDFISEIEILGSREISRSAQLFSTLNVHVRVTGSNPLENCSVHVSFFAVLSTEFSSWLPWLIACHYGDVPPFYIPSKTHLWSHNLHPCHGVMWTKVFVIDAGEDQKRAFRKNRCGGRLITFESFDSENIIFLWMQKNTRTDLWKLDKSRIWSRLLFTSSSWTDSWKGKSHFYVHTVQLLYSWNIRPTTMRCKRGIQPSGF